MFRTKVIQLEISNSRFVRENLDVPVLYLNESLAFLRQIISDADNKALESNDQHQVLEAKLLKNVVSLFIESYELINLGYSQQAYAIFRLIIEELTSIYAMRIGGNFYNEFLNNDLEVTKLISRFKEVVPQAGYLLGLYTNFSVHVKWEILGINLRPNEQGKYLTKYPVYDNYSCFFVVIAIGDFLKLSQITSGIIAASSNKMTPGASKEIDTFFGDRIEEVHSIANKLGRDSYEYAKNLKQ